MKKKIFIIPVFIFLVYILYFISVSSLCNKMFPSPAINGNIYTFHETCNSGFLVSGFWQKILSSTQQTPQTKSVAKLSKDNLVTKTISGKIITSGYNPDYDYGINSEGGQIAERLYFLSSDKKQRISVPDEIWSKLESQNDNRQITEFVLPVHPENKDVIFISTSEISKTKDNFNVNRIFAYNLKNYDLTEIYQEEVLYKDLSTAGIEGSKVLFVREDANSSPPACTGIWSPYKAKTHEYLELADIQAGLKPYTVPQYRLDQDEIEYTKCRKEIYDY